MRSVARGQDESQMRALRRANGAYRRYLTLCHRIGRNYYRPSSLRKRGMTPMMRTAVAAHVREVHEEYEAKGDTVTRDELMCLAALFARRQRRRADHAGVGGHRRRGGPDRLPHGRT